MEILGSASHSEPLQPQAQPSAPNPEPRSSQLMRYLTDLLATDLAANEQLPGERALAEKFAVTRPSVRNVLSRLERDGKIYRIHGVGTFASPPTIAKTSELTSFSEDMYARGLQPGARLIDRTVQPAGAEIGMHLGLSPADPVVHIRRLRLANGEPMCLEDVHLSHTRFGDILKAQPEASLYKDLEEHHRTRISSADQEIKATVLTAAQAELLGAAPFSPALQVTRVTFDIRRQPIEFTRSIYRGDRYSYSITIHRR